MRSIKKRSSNDFHYRIILFFTTVRYHEANPSPISSLLAVVFASRQSLSSPVSNHLYENANPRRKTEKRGRHAPKQRSAIVPRNPRFYTGSGLETPRTPSTARTDAKPTQEPTRPAKKKQTHTHKHTQERRSCFCTLQPRFAEVSQARNLCPTYYSFVITYSSQSFAEITQAVAKDGGGSGAKRGAKRQEDTTGHRSMLPARNTRKTRKKKLQHPATHGNVL